MDDELNDGRWTMDDGRKRIHRLVPRPSSLVPQNTYDHILLIGFGAPESPDQVEPFLRRFSNGAPFSKRMETVKSHYDAIGGASPYNRLVLEFARRLEERLRIEGRPLPVFAGMRHWRPFLKDTLAEARAKGLRRGIGVILAPHRSEASFNRYVRSVAEADPSASYAYVRAWHDNPLFI